MKRLIVMLILLSGVIAFTLSGQYDPGYVLIKVGDYSVESSFVILLLALFLSFILFYLLLRLFFGTLHIPDRITFWRLHRSSQKARKSTNQGLLALAEGDWPRAEKLLNRCAATSETPLINYLGAARAAQKQGALERRDGYLSQAIKSMPDATLAVGLTQAELQLFSEQSEQALATLRHLRTLAPKHVYVLHLLRKIYEHLESWDDLLELMPELVRYRVLDKGQAEKLQLRIYRDRIVAASADRTALQQLWAGIDKPLRTNAELLQLYADALVKIGAHAEAERQLYETLRHQWDASLMRLYGLARGEDVARQMATAEKWLKQYPQHPDQLLAMARICFYNKLWGKGRGYLEASIGLEPRAESYCELGQLLDQLDEKEEASLCFRKGLELASGEGCSPVIIPADGDRLHQQHHPA